MLLRGLQPYVQTYPSPQLLPSPQHRVGHKACEVDAVGSLSPASGGAGTKHSADPLVRQNGALLLSALQTWAVQRRSPCTSPGITENHMLPPKLGCHKTRHYLHSPRWHKFKHPEGNGEIGILITKVTVTWVGALVKCVKLWCIDISECVLGVFGLWSWKMPK